MSDNNKTYARIGTLAHVACILSTTAFCLLVAHAAGDATDNLFDDSWKTYGFCVTNLQVPYWTSHDVCFYVDWGLAAVFLGLYYYLKDTPGLEMANTYAWPAVLGMMAHGMGHGGIAHQLRLGFGKDAASDLRTVAEKLREDGLLVGSGNELLNLLFWLGLLYSAMPESDKGIVLGLSISARIGQSYMPTHMAFTYVQTVLMLAFSINQLFVRVKKFSFMMYPILVGFPLTIMGWIESLYCSSFVKDIFYGHVIYDGYIAVSLIVWYLICYGYESRKQKMS